MTLSIVQKIAKAMGKKDGKNTFFRGGIDHPDNVQIRMSKNVSIALGYVQKEHLPSIVKHNKKNLLPNTFSESLDG